MYPRILIAVIISFALAACTSASQGSSGTTATAASATRITAEEIAAAGVSTAFGAIERLHPNWFRDYTSASSGEIFVYMNNRKVEGGKEALRQVDARDVALLEYLRSVDAVMRFGPDAKYGAIIVTRK